MELSLRGFRISTLTYEGQIVPFLGGKPSVVTMVGSTEEFKAETAFSFGRAIGEVEGINRRLDAIQRLSRQ